MQTTNVEALLLRRALQYGLVRIDAPVA